MRQTDTSVFWQLEFRWLKTTIDARISQLVNLGGTKDEFDLGEGPDISLFPNPYTRFLQNNRFSKIERKALALALAPTLQPGVLRPFLDTRRNNQQEVPEFGGHRSGTGNAFFPSAETVLFLLAGPSVHERMQVLELFDEDHLFNRLLLLRLGNVEEGQSHTAGALIPSGELLALARGMESYQPKFGVSFPARSLKTKFEWEDLVLSAQAMGHIDHLRQWMKHESHILEEMGLERILAPGYRVLFHGPPGTGKSMTAALLGKELGLEVFRVDLSMVISKYIGETEKNLERVFQAAEHRNWLLFFDEADSLFGKRTKVKTSNDRFANQEVSYLLQRIENFDGTVILASNDKKNIDEAFARRFQMIVHFPEPTPSERFQIWSKLLPEGSGLRETAALQHIAKHYEISGGSIVNVVRYAAVKAAQRGGTWMLPEDLVAGIALEYDKAGKFMPTDHFTYQTNAHVPS